MKHRNGNRQILVHFSALGFLVLSMSCSKGFDKSKFAVIQMSVTGQGDGKPGSPAVPFSIAFKQGQSLDSAEVSEDLEITSPNVSDIKEIQMSLDSKSDKKLTASPFLFRVNLVKKENPIKVKAVATFNNGKTAEAEITVNPKMAGSGSIDAGCLTSSSFDACIFWKNPISHKKSAFSPAITYGQDVSTVQTYGVKLRGLTSQTELKSVHFAISAKSGQKAAPDSAGTYKFKYSDDSGKSFIAQLMAYFWMTEEIDIIKKKSGRFYAENKGMPVSSFDKSVQNNAYWDGRGIVLGEVTIPGRPSEVALGADVYIHELGHGNMQYAAGNTAYSTCASAAGCIGAINEGQADFHVALVFSQNPVLGEHFFNSMSGMPGRNVLQNRNLTGASAFSSGGGEVHNMGTVYASLLWEMYVHPGMVPLDFAKMFSQHLAMLTNSSTIANTKAIFESINTAQFGGKYKTVIDEVYKLKGY